MDCCTMTSNAVVMDTTATAAAAAAATTASAGSGNDSSARERKVSDATRRSMATADFDVWRWKHDELIVLLKEIYRDLGLVDSLHINKNVLNNFLLTVESSYRANPFHNFRHCFCVTQMMYVLLRGCQQQLETALDRAEVAALVTACVCHDLDHPGLSNSYHKNAQTDLYSRHSESPLENHHNERTMAILSGANTNIFGQLDDALQERIRQDISSLILATDMSHHAAYVGDFNSRVRRGFDFSNSADVSSLKHVLIKACDISNECRPVGVSEAWADCLLKEYFTQGDREHRMGLPVSALMDRESTNKPDAQIGFINFVLLPFFESIAQVLPRLKVLVLPNLSASLAHYENMKKSEQQQNHSPPSPQ